MQVQYIKQFSTKINGIQYPVVQMRLIFQVGSIQRCQLHMACGTQLTSTKQTTNITSLYKQLIEQSNITYPQVVITDNSTGQLFFMGIAVAMSPSISGGASSSQIVVCSCLGMPGKLLYNPLTDFVFAPAGSNSPQNMENAGYGAKPGYKDLWSVAQANFQKCFADATNSKMTLDQIYQTFQDQLAEIKVKVLVANKDQMKAMPAISDYIKSKYRPAAIAELSQVGLHTYAQYIFNIFKQGILSGQPTISCVQASLAGNTLLHMTPSGDGSCMWIAPIYQYGLQGTVMKFSMSDILAMSPTVDAAARVRQPGTLRVNFAAKNMFQAPSQKNQQTLTGIIGQYTQKANNTYKQIVGPWWLVQSVEDQKRKNRQQAEKNKTQVKVVDFTAIYNAYAKYAYAQLYGRSSACSLSLAPLKKNLKIKDCIGKAVHVDLSNMGISSASNQLWKFIKGFYGVVSYVNITVKPVADRGKSSVFSVQCSLQRMTAQTSPFASLFTQKLNSKMRDLYQKVGK